MPITPGDVWEWIPPSTNRQGEPKADTLMTRIVNAVEAFWLERWSSLIAEPVTVTAADDRVSFAGHGYTADAAIVLSGVTAADPLRGFKRYFVRDVTTETFRLALVTGGTAIDVTVDGTAMAPPGVRPVYLDQALIMQSAALYERRQTRNGVVAGSETLGPIRVSRFDPDVERLLNDESWGVR